MKTIFTYFQTERPQEKIYSFIRTFLSTKVFNYIALTAHKVPLKLAPLTLINGGISPILFYKSLIPNLHKALLIVPVRVKEF